MTVRPGSHAGHHLPWAPVSGASAWVRAHHTQRLPRAWHRRASVPNTGCRLRRTRANPIILPPPPVNCRPRGRGGARPPQAPLGPTERHRWGRQAGSRRSGGAERPGRAAAESPGGFPPGAVFGGAALATRWAPAAAPTVGVYAQGFTINPNAPGGLVFGFQFLEAHG